ncbi:hypothetical protein [Streptomyces sp. NPDC008001]|uniref:hypothetical protein n=1 Tax=Streptomyces sp. NPDC008001 TaxID=3364804 RepID=UPI0036DFC533
MHAHRIARKALVTGAAAAALLSGVALGTAPAMASTDGAPTRIPGRYTMDVGSNVRGGPNLHSRIYGTAGRGAYIDVDCWARGQDVNTGNHHTDVWYQGGVWTGPRPLDPPVWVWGGNVDTPHDPPRGLEHC